MDAESLAHSSTSARLAGSVLLILVSSFLFALALCKIFHEIFMRFNERFKTLPPKEQRAAEMHATRSVIELCGALYLAPPMYTVLTDSPWTPASADLSLLAFLFCCSTYSCELAYRLEVRMPTLVHHVSAMLLIAMTIDAFNPYTHGDVAFFAMQVSLSRSVSVSEYMCDV